MIKMREKVQLAMCYISIQQHFLGHPRNKDRVVALSTCEAKYVTASSMWSYRAKESPEGIKASTLKTNNNLCA